MPYHHLSVMERGQLQLLYSQGLGIRAIARHLRRSPSTISRELTRNCGGAKAYDPLRAQARYMQVRKECRRSRSLDHLPLRHYVIDKLVQAWSPEQMSGRLWLDFPGQPRMRVSPETIYRSLYADETLGRIGIGSLRRRRPRRRKHGERRPVRPMIPNRIGIEERPREVDALSRFGDWEGDLVIGAHQRGAVLTLVERKSMLLRARALPSRHAAPVSQAVIEALNDLPAAWLNTITFDNGSEFAHHERITQNLGPSIYFAHPYAAHERGRNENTNGLLRQYLPKDQPLDTLTHEQLDRILKEINNRPRKKLGYRSPEEVRSANTVALTV
jgi:IS30 family transposase